MRRGKRPEVYDFFGLHCKEKNPCLVWAGSGNFNLHLGVGQSVLCQKEGVGHVFFIDHISKCYGTLHPILFGQSLTTGSVL